MLTSFHGAAFASPAVCRDGAEAVPASDLQRARLVRSGRSLAALGLAACVAACGGSGGATDVIGSSQGTVLSVTKFPLQAAYKAFIVRGSAQAFAIGGDCAGTATLQITPPADATFENLPGKSVVYANDIALPNCVLPVSDSNGSGGVLRVVGSTGSQYFDTAYAALGTSDRASYGRYESSAGGLAPVALPSFVSAGDSGLLGTQRLYTDASRSVPVGRTELSYEIRAETATTVSTRLVTTTYDAAGTAFLVQTSTYRLGLDGSFVPIAVDIDFPVLPLHLLLTAR
jgi:hypothetical protein